MRIFVVFGSESDNAIYDPLVNNLKQAGFDTRFEVISAHRNLEKLQAVMKDSPADVVIAGAGLAAALPGVVAAMTPVPVFGVPVAAHFEGADALASIVQMPYGVPVMTCGPDRENAIVSFLGKCRGAQICQGESIPVVLKRDYMQHSYVQAELERSQMLAGEKGVNLHIVEEPVDGQINIVMVGSADDVRADCLGFHVPLIDKTAIKQVDSFVKLFHWTQLGGLWVGANNTRNAILGIFRMYHAQQKEIAA